MAKVKVFNVGQGDSILLEPEEGCDFCGEVFLIDVGPGNLDIMNIPVRRSRLSGVAGATCPD